MHPKLWPFFLPLISPTVYNDTLKPAAPFVSKDCRQTALKQQTKKLSIEMAKLTKERGKNRGDGGLQKEPSVSDQNQISKGEQKKNSGVANINQTVHLVGNHMAHQHANCANLLIFSNRVQLIPLAAFISPSHTGGKMVCYDFLLIFLKSVLYSSSFF